MLTGYLYAEKKKFSTNSIIKLLTIVEFYCFAITIIVFILRKDLFLADKLLIVKYIFPPIASGYWYVTSYVFLFFMIPYLNLFIKNFKKEHFKILLIILFVLLSVFSTFGLRDYFKISKGYSPFWLIFCYFVGAYIKINGDIFVFSKFKKICIFLVNIFIIMLAKNTASFILYEYISPLIVINAIFMLEIFSNIKLKDTPNKILLSLSNSTFSVYIIHSHIFCFDYLINNKFTYFGNKNTFIWFINLIIAIVGIYSICWVIDIFRKKVFDILHFNNIFKKISEKLDKILKWDKYIIE